MDKTEQIQLQIRYDRKRGGKDGDKEQALLARRGV